MGHSCNVSRRPGAAPSPQASATRFRIDKVPARDHTGITQNANHSRTGCCKSGARFIAKTPCAASNNCKVCRGKTPLVLDPPALRPAPWKIGYPKYGVGLMKKIALSVAGGYGARERRNPSWGMLSNILI